MISRTPTQQTVNKRKEYCDVLFRYHQYLMAEPYGMSFYKYCHTNGINYVAISKWMYHHGLNMRIAKSPDAFDILRMHGVETAVRHPVSGFVQFAPASPAGTAS